MTLICFASQKGSPGATATSLAVAASFQVAEGRHKVLLEADSTGGTLAIRYRMPAEPGLLTLAAAVRGGLKSSDGLWRHTQELPGGLPVIVCPDGPEQVNAAMAAGGAQLGRFLNGLRDVDVLCDVGRLAPDSPSLAFVAEASAVLMVARPTAEQLQPAARRMLMLRPLVANLGWVLVGQKPYGPLDVESTYDFPVVGVMADDARSLASLEQGLMTKRLRRQPFVRSAATLADTLATWLAPITTAKPVEPDSADAGPANVPDGPPSDAPPPEDSDSVADLESLPPPAGTPDYSAPLPDDYLVQLEEPVEVVPADIPVEAPAPIPSDVAVDASGELPSDVPSEAPGDVPSEASGELSSDVSRDVPIDLVGSSPPIEQPVPPAVAPSAEQQWAPPEPQEPVKADQINVDLDVEETVEVTAADLAALSISGLLDDAKANLDEGHVGHGVFDDELQVGGQPAPTVPPPASVPFRPPEAYRTHGVRSLLGPRNGLSSPSADRAEDQDLNQVQDLEHDEHVSQIQNRDLEPEGDVLGAFPDLATPAGLGWEDVEAPADPDDEEEIFSESEFVVPADLDNLFTPPDFDAAAVPSRAPVADPPTQPSETRAIPPLPPPQLRRNHGSERQDPPSPFPHEDPDWTGS